MEIVRKLSKKEKETIKEQEAVVNQEKIDKAQQNFDTFNAVLVEKKYPVKLSQVASKYLIEEMFSNIKFKGAEAYAVKEVYDNLLLIKEPTNKESNSNYLFNGELKPEVIEAMFFFIKQYEGRGYLEASLFKEVADGFSSPMQLLNEDRQHLRDLSLELIAAEQGVEVEKVKEQYSQQG